MSVNVLGSIVMIMTAVIIFLILLLADKIQKIDILECERNITRHERDTYEEFYKLERDENTKLHKFCKVYEDKLTEYYRICEDLINQLENVLKIINIRNSQYRDIELRYYKLIDKVIKDKKGEQQ